MRNLLGEKLGMYLYLSINSIEHAFLINMQWFMPQQSFSYCALSGILYTAQFVTSTLETWNLLKYASVFLEAHLRQGTVE